MGRPYSIDLRKKAVAAVESGKRVQDVAQAFSIRQNTLYEWIKLKKETGSLEGKTDYQKGHSHKIKDLSEFKKIIDENPHDSNEKIAEKIGYISDTTVWRLLQKLGYSKKK